MGSRYKSPVSSTEAVAVNVRSAAFRAAVEMRVPCRSISEHGPWRSTRWHAGARSSNYGDTGGDEATIPVAGFYWHWRSLVGTMIGSPRECCALCGHGAAVAIRPAVDSVHALEGRSRCGTQYSRAAGQRVCAHSGTPARRRGGGGEDTGARGGDCSRIRRSLTHRAEYVCRRQGSC
jgi:hypothetical protein